MAESNPSSGENDKFPYNGLKEAVSVKNLTTHIELEGKRRQPRRVVHFSDGILEEYSTDEEDGEKENKVNQHFVDPTMLPWSKWLLHRLGSAASNTLSAADYCGEKLAWFFGITTPKYQYALNEIQRRQLEERENEERENEVGSQHRDKQGDKQDQTFVNLECSGSEGSKPTNISLGYDNVVFSSDENTKDLEKF